MLRTCKTVTILADIMSSGAIKIKDNIVLLPLNVLSEVKKKRLTWPPCR